MADARTGQTQPPRRGRPPPHRGRRGPGWLPYALLAPALLVYGVFVAYPLATTVRLSFYDWDGLTPPVAAGLSNYAALLSGGRFLPALAHNAAFVVFYAVLPIALALAIAGILAQQRLRGLAAYRMALFAPYVMPMVVVGVVWRWLYSPVNGAVNALVVAFGGEPVAFLGRAATALPAVGLVGTWVQTGFALVLFLAGAQRIDRSLFEAAAVDGAGLWRTFRHVTVPSLRGEIAVAAVVSLIAALRVFDVVYVMTRGGPADATNVAAFEIYRRAFLVRDIGGAAAASTVLVLLVLGLSRAALALGRPAR